jgi:uncharacterized protein YbaR (Trm112 family)
MNPIPTACPDCKKFLYCEKNSEYWKKAKTLFPERLFKSNFIIKQMKYMQKDVFDICTDKII